MPLLPEVKTKIEHILLRDLSFLSCYIFNIYAVLNNFDGWTGQVWLTLVSIMKVKAVPSYPNNRSSC